jgi:hypothetical protein
MVHLTQTMHVSSIKVTTITKWTQTSFHMTLVTSKHHRVRPKRFMRLLYVRRKPCTYIAPTLTLSPNRPKQDFTWPTHLGVPSSRPRRFSSRWYIQHKLCSYLASRLAHLQMDPNKLRLEPRHLGVSSGASKMISEPIVRSAQTVLLYCTETNSIPKRTETRFHMTNSPRSSIRYIQDEFLAYDMFNTNHAPTLSQD